MSAKKVTVLNYSGIDVANFTISQNSNGSNVLFSSTALIPEGTSAVYSFNTDPSITAGFFNLTRQEGGSQADCMAIDGDSYLILANTQPAAGVFATTCPPVRNSPYPGTPINFIEGDNYWIMDAAAYSKFIADKSSTTYMVAFNSTLVDVSTLTPWTKPPPVVQKPPAGGGGLPAVTEGDTTSYTWLWVMMIVLLLILIVAAVIGGIYYYKRSR
jgi:hypothetical protein